MLCSVHVQGLKKSNEKLTLTSGWTTGAEFLTFFLWRVCVEMILEVRQAQDWKISVLSVLMQPTYVIQWPETEWCIFIINFIRATFLCDGCVQKGKSNNLKSHSIVEDCRVLLFYIAVYNIVTAERAR